MYTLNICYQKSTIQTSMIRFADASNTWQFRDVYRFFSISPPQENLDGLCFRVITRENRFGDFPFFAFLSEMRYL